MLHINVICVGKIKESFFRDAILEYSKRLSRFCNLTITELQDEKISEKASEKIEQEIKEKEGQNIISHIKKDSYVIALDLTGKEINLLCYSICHNSCCRSLNHNACLDILVITNSIMVKVAAYFLNHIFNLSHFIN